MNHSTIKALVQSILLNPHVHNWTLQGFGMLRTYLPGPENLRLHVWDNRYKVPSVSEIHTHPWDFESYIVAGVVKNCRYRESQKYGSDFLRQSIKCGEGCHFLGEPTPLKLEWGCLELFSEGDTYTQTADEIHSSSPAEGSITIVQRKVPAGGNPDMAHVYWKANEQWISAEPRPATFEEICDITQFSLKKWF